MKKLSEFKKTMPLCAQNLALSLTYFKSFFPKNIKNLNQSKKSFFPVVSFVLSSFLISFSGELRADEVQGDASCKLGDETSCASLSTSSDFSQYLKMTPTSGGTGYNLSYKQASSKVNFPDVNLNANNTIINAQLTGEGLYGSDIYNQNMKSNYNFKNSLWNGDFIISSDYYPVTGKFLDGDYVFTVNFDGNYNDTTNPSNPLNGYALKGDIKLPYNDSKSIVFNFTNANMLGGIDTTRGVLTVNLINSTMTGALSVNYRGTLNLNASKGSVINLTSIKDSTGGYTDTINLNLDNSTAQSTVTGDVYKHDRGNFNIKATNNSRWVGNIIIDKNSYKLPLNDEFNFTNSSFTGNITTALIQFPSAQLTPTFNFSGNNSTDGYAWKGNLENTGINDLTVNLNDDAIWIGDVKLNQDGIGTDAYNTLNLTNSAFIGNYTAGRYNYPWTSKLKSTINLSGNSVTQGFAWKGDFAISDFNANITLTNGAIWKGNANLKGGTTTITLDGGASMDTMNVSGGTTIFSASGGSSVSTINRSGGTSNYTFDNSTVNTYSVTGGSGAITLNNNSTLNTLKVGVGFSTGVNLNSGSTLKNVDFTNAKAGGGATITADNSHIGGFYTDNGASATLTLNNHSTLGAASQDGSIPATLALGANWGNITATLDNSTAYGTLTWQDGILNATFQNNSALIGNIGQQIWPSPASGNVSVSSNVTFSDSSMKGDILVYEKTKAGKHSTLNTSFSGNSSFEGSMTSTGAATLNASFDGTKLNIKDISLSSLKADSTLSFKNISGASIGNINFTNGTLSGDFSSSSLGDITNTNINSSLSLSDTAGQTYGNIGSSTSTYNGSLKASFDFTQTSPADTTAKIGDIYLGANANANLSFAFSGLDSNTNSLIGKQSITDSTTNEARNVKITGGNANSSYAFSNIGTLNLSSGDGGTAPAILDLVASNTGIALDNVKGALSFSKTNIVLNNSALSSASAVNANSVFSLKNGNTTATSKGAINTGNSTFNVLNATFGNATLGIDDTGVNPTIIANNATNPNDISSFYTLTQNKPNGSVDEDTQDSTLAGKTSNGDIGYVGDNVEKHISFVFTQGTFDNKHSAYTGTIAGGTDNSTYSFYNAGLLNVSQLTNYLGSLNLYDTYLTGVLGKSIETTGADGSITSTPKDVSISLDYSSSNSEPYSLAIVGTGKHNITFNFTGNYNNVKFAGSVLGGTTSKIAGSKNTDNTITIYGLEGLATKTGEQKENPNSLMAQLHNAGVIGFNAVDGITNSDGTTSSFTDENSPSYIAGYSSLKDTDKQSIAQGTTFKFLNTTFNSNLIEKDYALDLTFSSDEIAQDSNIKNTNNDSSSLIANPNKLIPLTASSFKGGLIDLSANIYDNKLSFLGKGSIANAYNLLNISLGSGATTLRAIDTESTLVLKNTDKAAASSSLTLINTSLVGDWSLGGSFVFGDNDSTTGENPTKMNSKFYGKLSNTTSTGLDITLNTNALFSSEDALVKNNYEGSLKTDADAGVASFDVPTISFANTNNAKNKLILNNPGGVLKIEGLSSTVTLSDDSSLVSNNTSIIGDLYTPIKGKKTPVFADLSFNTTGKDSNGNASVKNFYQGNNIGVFASGSSLSFTGKASIRSQSYDSTLGTDSGWVNIGLPGNNGTLNLTLNNTGANVALNQDGSNVGWFIGGTYNIRGTNIKVNKMDSDSKNVSSNMVFAKASASTQDLLKTSDGSLITSSTASNGSTKDINDYVETSTLVTAGRIQLRGGNHNFTFIGDNSFSTTSTQTLLANFASTVGVNLINLGSALNSNLKVGGTNLTDILFASATGGGNSQSTYNYTIRGTSLGDTLVSSGTFTKDTQTVKVNFDAVFDNRDLSDRKDDSGNAQTSLQYYNNSAAIGNTSLDIAKSALNGNLVLGNTAALQKLITATLSFYGNDSFTENASISGGSSASTFSFNDMNLNFGKDGANQSLNVNGNVTLSNVAAYGFLSSIGSGTISTANLKAASGTTTSTANVLAFGNYDLSASTKTDVSNISGIDYSSIKQGGSFKGTLATSKAMTYTFIGQNAQGFNVAPSIDETTSSVSNKNDLTTLDSSLNNATINVVDGGVLQTKNLEGTAKGNSNTLNLYGNTGLSTTEGENGTKTLSINSAGLTINATIDSSNASLWNGGVDTNGNASVNFNISNSASDTDGSKSAIYNLTFNGNYKSPDYDHQFYKGTITGLNANSNFIFNSAGFLYDSQFGNTQAKITLNDTIIKGNLSIDKIDLDFRAQEGYSQGVQALSGNIIKTDTTQPHIKDISFDFTGNTLADKIKNTQSGTDGKYYLAGDKGSKFTFINLKDNSSDLDVPDSGDGSISWKDSTTDNTTKTTSDGVFNTLVGSGVYLRAARSTASVGSGGEALLEGDYATIASKTVPQNLDPDSTFNFYGSTIHALDDGSVSSSYSLGFIFDSRANAQDRLKVGGLQSTLDQSSYYGTSISSDKDLSIALYGKDAFKNDSSTLTLKAGNNRMMNILADSNEGSMGTIVIDNASKSAFKSGSSLYISGAGLKGVYLTSVDNTDSKNPKGGNITASFDGANTLGEDSILGTKDGNLSVSINDSNAIADTSKAPTIIIGNGTSVLNFNNAGVIKINSSGKSFAGSVTDSITQTSWDGNSAGSYFGAGSSIVASGTSIIGDIYGGVQSSNSLTTNLNADLSFDSTTSNPTFYQGGSTNTIQGMKFGSSLSFIGKGSLRSSQYDNDKGTDSGSVAINFLGNNLFNLTANNTGGTLDLSRVANWASASPKGDITWNIRGTSVNMLTSIDGTSNGVMNWNLSFASSDDNSLLNTQDGSLLTSSVDKDGNAKDINDYIENSTLAAMWSKYRNGTLNITLIGDKALKSSNANMGINPNASVNFNLINMGSAFVGSTNATDGSAVANNTNLNNILTTGKPDANGGKENILILGTTIEDATTNTDAGVNVSLGAIFDNRDLNDRVTSNGNAQTSLQYYSNSIAMGNTNLQIAKSSLLGTLTLDSNIKSNLAFYGKDAISSAGKIVGGNSQSNVIVSLGVQKDTATGTISNGSLNFSSIKGFKGNVYVLNTSLSGALEDKKGASLSDGSGLDADASVFNSLTISFNDNKEGLKAGLDAYNKNHTADVENTDASTYLSSDASAFITSNIIGNIKDVDGNALDLDLNNTHVIDQAIGYTNSALNVNFIGAGSIKGAYSKTCDDKGANCTYAPTKDSLGNISGFYIHDDNAKNVYNFIDFGKIDVSTFAENGQFNGKINWVGNSYQIGLIKNGLGNDKGGPMEIDFSDLPDSDVANNIYQAQTGVQNVLFDFGGNTAKTIDESDPSKNTYKMNGAILQGDKTQDSSYIFSNLGNMDINDIDVSTGGSTGEKDFYDVLNKTINANNWNRKDDKNQDMSALQLKSGTIGINDTAVKGDIIWNKIAAKDSTADDPSYDRNITLKANFDNTYSFDGSLKGDGSKDITFDGEKSFNKDVGTPSVVGVSPAPTIIEGGDANSSYSFNNVGVITQATLNNLLNAGSAQSGDDPIEGKASNSGSFNFDGATAILANITDAKDTKNIASQTINLGKSSDKGVVIKGEISTSAKVDAKFGVGSEVKIVNKNDQSSYDFSSFASSGAPLVASIDLDAPSTDASTASVDGTSDTSGIKKATIIGLDQGTVSLIGSINDSNQNSTTSNNAYKFGDWDTTDKTKADSKASWLLSGDSSVATLQVYNHSASEQAAALNSSTFSNAGSVIDLRGARMLSKAQNSNSMMGSVLLGANLSDNNPGDFTPTKLEVQNANLDNAIFRLGVDTNTNQADTLIINQVAINDGKSSGYRTTNALQVYLDQGSLAVDNPILLAQVSDSQGQLNSNYFFGAGYAQGLYNITPELMAVDNATLNSPSEGSGTPENPYAPSGETPDASAGTTDTNTAVVAGATTAPSANIIAAADTSSTPSDTTPNPDLGKSMSWYLTGFNASADTSTANTLASTLGTFYRDFRIATNNLNLRMGELRGNVATQGVWARIINGMGSDTQNNKDFYTTLQAGYDYRFDVLGGVNYLGVDAEATMVSSKGDAYTSSGRNLGVGIYNTYIMDNGFYVDASAKYLNLGNRISIANSIILSDTTSNLTSNAFLLGAEVGYRYSLDTLMKLMKAPINTYTQGYYVEPQLELIYGYITGNNYNVAMNNAPINVALSGSNAVISRLGAVLGKHFKYVNGMLLDVRVGLSYINELNTGGKTTLTQESGIGSTLAPISLNTLSNNKLNLSLGANVKLSDDWRLYADISRTFLGVYNFDYNLNVGARFSFGKKISDLEKRIKENKSSKDKVDTSDKKTEAKEKTKLLEEKKTVKLDTKGAKIGCQGCLPEAGLYLQVAVLAHKDSSALKEISKHSYRAYEFELTTKDKKKEKVTRYLIGPFKNLQEVYENKNLADSMVQNIDGDKKAYAIMYEVK